MIFFDDRSWKGDIELIWGKTGLSDVDADVLHCLVDWHDKRQIGLEIVAVRK